MTFSIRADLSGVDALFDELGDAAEEAARPAAQAAAQVVYDEAKRNVARLGRVTGKLDNAIYQVFSKSESAPGKATYAIGWNSKKAPHAWLVENGYLQRYVTYRGENGQIYVAIRPNMRGKPKPRRRASQAEKDAYYVTLATPKQIAAKPFLRPAQAKFDDAMKAAADELFRRINGGEE